MSAPLRRHAAYLGALLLDLVGAGGALLVSTRTWQTIVTPRPRPLPNDVLDVSGRTIDSASTALALVALAGVVAVVATRGVARRVVGAVVALAGAGLIWRGLAAAPAVGTARARSLAAGAQRSVVTDDRVVPLVTTHLVWPVLSVLAGAVVLLAGVLVATRGHRWGAMSARYDASPERAQARDADPARAATTLWNALDRGEDPTSR